MTTERKVFAFVGLPGAGKTTAAEMTAEMTGGTAAATGDIVREMFKDERDIREMTSENLADFAAEKRGEQGPAFATLWYIREVLSDNDDFDYPLCIDGLRHADEVRELREFATTLQCVWLAADRQTRLERLTDRGREGEADFSEQDLMVRDKKERDELGVSTLLDEGVIDTRIDNTKTLDALRVQLVDKLWLESD